MPAGDRPQWQLPTGVSRGVWQYTLTNHIATAYDNYFSENSLFQFDEEVLLRYFTTPGLVVDLGCGTGRTLLPLAKRGFQGLGVDLSFHMLRVTGTKADRANLPIWRIRANLVELDCIRDQSTDYCTCLFSTLGMIRGRQNRGRVLGHALRILKPGGLFVAHVHNVWFNLFDPIGRRWLAKQLLGSIFRKDVDLGDKYFDYRGIPKMYLHTFSQRELVRGLKGAGFRMVKLIPLAVTRQRPLACPWLLGRFRANGWIAVCRRPDR